MIRNIVLLNDTSYENHHGCNIVISNIEKNFIKRDVNILYKNPIGTNWKYNENFLRYLKETDAVVVNAEGTIHSNSEYAYSLLEVVDFTDKPCYLINMTYQDNDKKFAQLVKKFRKVFVRESFSLKELMKHDIRAKIVPDMTFFDFGYNIQNSKIRTTIVTDSHDINKSRRLYDFSKKNNYNFLPVLSPFHKSSNYKGLIKKIRYYLLKNLVKFSSLEYKYKRLAFILNQNDYLDQLSNGDFLISARFHTICLSLHFKIPFIAIKSNTFKIEALLKDIGLNSNRIISIDDIGKIDKVKKDYIYFDKDELKNIDSYINNANKLIANMFDEIIGD